MVAAAVELRGESAAVDRAPAPETDLERSGFLLDHNDRLLGPLDFQQFVDDVFALAPKRSGGFEIGVPEGSEINLPVHKPFGIRQRPADQTDPAERFLLVDQFIESRNDLKS